MANGSRLISGVTAVGASFIQFCSEMGCVFTFFIKTLKYLFRRPFYWRNLLKQMEEIGVRSLPVVAITATFTGMVLALQSYSGFRRFGAESLMGTVVALSMLRELGPVFSGLMVSGRIGSAMAAELGTMAVTEQIDALVTLATNPIQYLIVPRFLASTIVLPILVLFADLLGIIGGYVVAVYILGTNATVFITNTTKYTVLKDLYFGLLKAAVFGMIIATVSCCQGFNATEGAEGVGRATTRAVVYSSLMILIFDYILTAYLF